MRFPFLVGVLGGGLGAGGVITAWVNTATVTIAPTASIGIAGGIIVTTAFPLVPVMIAATALGSGIGIGVRRMLGKGKDISQELKRFPGKTIPLLDL
ncbi:MAG: hypothetical protein QNJ54_38015 [Prochloraceae cyanobacterium]|nr:hypothetical protein [Prochloraceae cyanobacterium]